MIRTVFTAQIFQIGAGLSGYIAELGSVFFCADLGIAPALEPRPDHASYLASWLKFSPVRSATLFPPLRTPRRLWPSCMACSPRAPMKHWLHSLRS